MIEDIGAHMPLVVTFEVDQARSASLIDAVKSLGDWSALTSSSYLLATNVGAGGVIERLQPLLGPADSLWVISASGPWAGYGSPEVEDHTVTLLGREDDWVPKDWDNVTKSRP